MKPMANSLNQTLLDRRKKLGLTQAKLAGLTGKTQAQIARIEKGADDPRLSSVTQVSRGLGMELIAIPLRFLPAVQHLLSEHGHGLRHQRSNRLVGNSPDDISEDNDE